MIWASCSNWRGGLMTTIEERQLGQGKNAVMSYLERNLIVPKIYVDADWGGHQVDILAIDRDGVGAVHAVMAFLCTYKEDGILNTVEYAFALTSLANQLAEVPANYKYIAAIETRVRRLDLDAVTLVEMSAKSFLEKSFSPDGMGRIAILSIQPSGNGNEMKAALEIKAERFRAKIAKLADEYVQKHEADWEIRA
jgi:hypothetical protein